ncbi:hypothetical protein CcaverHIS002_0600060 [Cutaneotrichosporon cavernicola]|uniref:Glycosyltransferase family 28 N-terminal domain-containing protein n=1 Tax=Cutaneotrichosporon cavernicola TaxID=279322 RepID=A0AA48L5J6_9TREE|nr:uncharacterized protein CcaverHIS019_0500170 [Cutaneotrichosporon cavernicola]BEI85719.1 hypothetical protein CcaverHIS002_0600060 [Cutaneotrichosporon cavernicola]BEI92389.1 hypothetical protein CcaverHIS019_0500170 [Cutaneotrichosporon cavernicola]BEJ00160.1 hypothetical protein CcaverHIS631_0500170 [Cutaneotrichosporon cavernicola]BEJ07931.1 hypothetical protein CcaverHIS641_0500160 [Cutaneotrichosporon cavernicola]
MNELERTSQDESPPYPKSETPYSPSTPEIVDHEALGIDFAEVGVSGPDGDTRARVADNGMIDMWLTVDVDKPLPQLPLLAPPRRVRPLSVNVTDCPRLNIVIFVVGSRGDVQPYLALAIRLIQANGHRVRLATHSAFKDLVLAGNEHLRDTKYGDLTGHLEFFDVGGDPKELMAFMVKNPGLMPGFESLTNGDISSKRRMVGVMLNGFARSCSEPDQASNVPFAADVIISNPPSFAHVHVAEALGLPLIISFTMPWSPTSRFPHPLANVQRSNAGESVTNYLSYALADTLMWQGLGDIVNRFRVRLGISPLSALTGPMSTERLRVPVIYGWSPSLLPKPDEWRDNIDVVGFLTMPTTVSYTPDEKLRAFLAEGPPPIYIGFGSIVVKNPDALTHTILEAVKSTGVRALLSAGWSDLGGLDIPESVFVIKSDIPHDWLFADGRVAAVCHHGGAGTTAAGLRAGLPTIVVPFFGDQLFWGNAVAAAGAGPLPIPYKKLTADALANGIQVALSNPARLAAGAIGESIRAEDGTQAGVSSVHRLLPLEAMRCDVDASRAAQWWCKKHWIRLSNVVAGVMVSRKVLKWDDLRPLRVMEYETGRVFTEPVTAMSDSLLSITATGMIGTAQLLSKRPHKGLKKLTWGLLKGGGDVTNALYQGVDNLSGMMGTRVRPRALVSGFGEGVWEGSKGLMYGLMDGVTGLVTEPIDGYQRSGIGGAVAGFGRGLGNLYCRPMTGMLGVIVLPTQGAYRSIRTAKKKGGPLTPARRAESENAAAALTSDEAGRLVVSFLDATQFERTKVRRDAERLRQKELAIANAHDDLTPEEMREMATRDWWKQAIPPPRPERHSRTLSMSEEPSGKYLTLLDQKVDALKGDNLCADLKASESKLPSPVPPPLPPRKKV